MKLANTIHLSVFSKEHEDSTAIRSKLESLAPFDLGKEKVGLKTTDAEGFDRTIKIFEIILSKEKHTSAFLKEFVNHLSAEQKNTLLSQFDSRCDTEYNFFIRLDKDMLLYDNYELTDTGNCFHIKINLACYPKNLESAKAVAKKILG